MRAIDREGNFDDYFKERLIKSLRKTKKIISSVIEEDFFDCWERKISSQVWDYVRLYDNIDRISPLSNDDFYIKWGLIHFDQVLAMGEIPNKNFLIPLDKYLEKNKHVLPFEDYMNENPNQLNFNFR